MGRTEERGGVESPPSPEGVGVLARGWVPFFFRMAPIFTVQMTIYEQCRRLLGLSYME